MPNLASNLPLQDMIRSVINDATTKLASANQTEKVRQLISYEKKEHGHIPTPSEERAEKTASAGLLDFAHIEKLAQAVDYIAANVDQIEVQSPGVIAGALKKMATEGSPQGAGKGPGALEVSKAIGGTQKYKKDKPAGPDAAASQAGSTLSAGGLPGGKTQLDNNMHHAPGGGSLTPTGKYPAEGPIRASKTASIVDRYKAVIEKNAAEIRGQVAAPSSAPKQKTAADIARSAIMRKLAGEDVMKANISSPKDADALPGGGVLKVMKSGESGSGAGGPTSSDGNQGRSLISSNQKAIDATKGQAKGPQKTQLGEVLDEPALSPAHDSKLRENLRDASSAGVKIAAVAALKKIAQKGCQCEGKGECSFCQLKEKTAAIRSKKKTANAMMGAAGGMGGGMGGGAAAGGMGGGGGGMASMAAGAGASVDGCMCGNTGQCRVCKLKAAVAAAKAGGDPSMMGGMPSGAPVEKDSMGAAPTGGMY